MFKELCEKMVKPNYYVCGAGSERNCIHWDDINGCWNGCKEIGDKNCEPPDDEDEFEE